MGQESERYEILSIRQSQGCIVQHVEYSPYFVTFKIVYNLKKPIKLDKPGFESNLKKGKKKKRKFSFH